MSPGSAGCRTWLNSTASFDRKRNANLLLELWLFFRWSSLAWVNRFDIVDLPEDSGESKRASIPTSHAAHCSEEVYYLSALSSLIVWFHKTSQIQILDKFSERISFKRCCPGETQRRFSSFPRYDLEKSFSIHLPVHRLRDLPWVFVG